MSDTAVAVPTKADRLSNGRFAPGCKPGPGNPDVGSIISFRRAIQRALTPAQLQRIIRKMSDMALEGNAEAAKVVLDRVCGKPLQPVDLSGSIAVTHSAIIAAAFNGGFPRESRIDEALRIAESAPFEVAAEVDRDGD